MASWERLAGERGGRERVMRRWQGENDAMLVRWQGGKGGAEVKWPGGRFLVLFKSWVHRVTPRFCIFVSDVDQQQKLWKLVTIENEEIRRLRMKRLRRMRRLRMRKLVTNR